MNPMRPMPADFVEMAHKFDMQYLPLRRHYIAGAKTIIRWFTECGMRDPNDFNKRKCQRRPVPDDFAEVASRMTRNQMAAHYGVSHSKLLKWRQESGIEPLPDMGKVAGARREIPDDFAELAKTMTQTALARHYNVGNGNTIRRWIRDSGITPMKPARAGGVKFERQPYKPIPFFRCNPRSGMLQEQAKHRYSAEDAAADTLRRYAPVYRCNDKGAADINGKFWRMGNSLLTPAELLARAERKAA